MNLSDYSPEYENILLNIYEGSLKSSWLDIEMAPGVSNGYDIFQV